MDRVELELENRFVLLLVHGLMAWSGGWLMLFFGLGPALAQLPDGRLVLGLIGVTAGGTLIVSTLRRHALGWQMWAMLGVASWYGVLLGGYVVAAVLAPGDHPAISWPWEPSTNLAPPYPLAMFAGLFAFGVRHLLTLRALRKL